MIVVDGFRRNLILSLWGGGIDSESRWVDRCNRSCFGVFSFRSEGKAYSNVHDIDDNVVWPRLHGLLRNSPLPATWNGKYCFYLDGVRRCYRNRRRSSDQSTLSSLFDPLFHWFRGNRILSNSLNRSAKFLDVLGVEPLLSREATASKARASRSFWSGKERIVWLDASEEAKVDIQSVKCLWGPNKITLKYYWKVIGVAEKWKILVEQGHRIRNASVILVIARIPIKIPQQHDLVIRP